MEKQWFIAAGCVSLSIFLGYYVIDGLIHRRLRQRDPRRFIDSHFEALSYWSIIVVVGGMAIFWGWKAIQAVVKAISQ